MEMMRLGPVRERGRKSTEMKLDAVELWRKRRGYSDLSG
jgi:hypothetical protein